MKNYEELTLKGQFARCEKALSILSSNVNCSNVKIDWDKEVEKVTKWWKERERFINGY